MKLLQVQGLVGLFLAAVLSAPAWGSNASSNSAVPGTLNYVEGQVYINGQPVDHNSIGKTTVEVGQSLRTEVGKAEILLTPGVFLREGDNSSLGSSLVASRSTFTDTEAEVDTRATRWWKWSRFIRENNLRCCRKAMPRSESLSPDSTTLICNRIKFASLMAKP